MFDETGEFLCKQGNEFGATLVVTVVPAGWTPLPFVVRYSLNSLSGFCLTKLDVLDGLKK
ncbi:hypothetical protein ACLB1E_01965 [Escherichia coli]